MARNNKGFTLVELIVVTTIIGVLAGALAFGMKAPTQMKKARDTRRESDLNQYRNALENYASANNGVYPAVAAGDIANLCSTTLVPNFIASCPPDPTGGVYKYWSDRTDYTLWGRLEVQESGSWRYWKICSNGKSGKSTTDSQNCDI